MEEKRIYVVLAATVMSDFGPIPQLAGRQIAQACHAVSKLRHGKYKPHYIADVIAGFEPVTTIILQGRDENELTHVEYLARRKKLTVAWFRDTNKDVYGTVEPLTAIALFATKAQTVGVVDYLPLWGS